MFILLVKLKLKKNKKKTISKNSFPYSGLFFSASVSDSKLNRGRFVEDEFSSIPGVAASGVGKLFPPLVESSKVAAEVAICGRLACPLHE